MMNKQEACRVLKKWADGAIFQTKHLEAVNFALAQMSETVEVFVKYHGEMPHMAKIDQGDWIDLCTAEDVALGKGEYAQISLGVSMRLPDGYEAHVLPRSSTFAKFSIIMVNGMGIIDNSYCGDDDIWAFPALAIDPTYIPKGTRIAQFRIVKNQPDIKLVEVEELDGENRGGFGSTGV